LLRLLLLLVVLLLVVAVGGVARFGLVGQHQAVDVGDRTAWGDLRAW
jgi:hypothetical protein